MSSSLVGALAAGAAVAIAIVARTSAAPHAPIPSHPDRSSLGDAGWRRPLREWEAVRAGIAAFTLVAALTFGWHLATVLVAALAPSVWIRLRAEGARERAHRAVLPLTVAAEAALRSGAALPEALRRASAAIAEPIAVRPFRAALDEFELGASLDGALVLAAERSRDRRARSVLVTIALGLGERLPRERLADLLAAIADRLAFEDGLADEVRARASGARQQQRLVALLVPAIAVYLLLTMPVLATTLASDLGRFVLVPAAVCLELAGILLSRGIVRAASR